MDMKPWELYLSRPQYQEFDHKVFRKHIYQEIRKQKGQQYWLPKRNLAALKAHLAETEEIASKWEEDNLHLFMEKMSIDDVTDNRLSGLVDDVEDEELESDEEVE